MNRNDMKDGLYESEITSIDGWDYNFSALPLWALRSKEPWCTHKLIENNEHDIACLIYGVIEESMCSYRGYCAIFQNKNDPVCVAAFPNIKVWLSRPAFSKDGQFVLLPAQHNNVLVLDLKNKTFALVGIPISTPALEIIETDIHCFSFQAPETEMKNRLIQKTCKKRIFIESLSFESWNAIQ